MKTVETRPERISKALKADITEITKFGKVTIMFNSELKKAENISFINSTALEIKVLSSNEDLIPELTWTILRFSSAIIQLQVNFKDPLQISKTVIL